MEKKADECVHEYDYKRMAKTSYSCNFVPLQEEITSLSQHLYALFFTTKIIIAFAGFSDELEDVECGADGCQTQGMENQACLPIEVPRNDTVFGHKPCLMFVRSQEVPFSPSCRLGRYILLKNGTVGYSCMYSICHYITNRALY